MMSKKITNKISDLALLLLCYYTIEGLLFLVLGLIKIPDKILSIIHYYVFIITLLYIFYDFFKYGIKRDILVLCIIIVLLFLYSYNIIINYNELYVNIETNIAMGIVYIILASKITLSHDSWRIIKGFSYLGTFLILLIGILYRNMGDLKYTYTYMTIGYMALPSAVCFAIDVFGKIDFKSIVSFLIDSLFLVLFGSRFTLLIVIMAILTSLIITKTSIRKKIIILAVISLGMILVLLSYEHSNVYSRTMLSILTNSYFNDSGRYEYYQQAIRIINENPIWGVGMGVDRIIIGNQLSANTVIGSYPHNIFLEIYAQYGILVGTLFSILLLYNIQKKISSDNYYGRKIVLYFILSFGMSLLVSGSYLSNSLSWTVLGLCYTTSNLRCEGVDKEECSCGPLVQ